MGREAAGREIGSDHDPPLIVHTAGDGRRLRPAVPAGGDHDRVMPGGDELEQFIATTTVLVAIFLATALP